MPEKPQDDEGFSTSPELSFDKDAGTGGAGAEAGAEYSSTESRSYPHPEDDWSEELRDLRDRYNRGLISLEDYEKQRETLLNEYRDLETP